MSATINVKHASTSETTSLSRKRVTRKKNDQLRQERLQHANEDQINALSVLALNLLKGNIPMRHYTKKQLQPFATMLHTLGKRSQSIKARRTLLMNKIGRGFWEGLKTKCITSLKQ